MVTVMQKYFQKILRNWLFRSLTKTGDSVLTAVAGKLPAKSQSFYNVCSVLFLMNILTAGVSLLKHSICQICMFWMNPCAKVNYDFHA